MAPHRTATSTPFAASARESRAATGASASPRVTFHPLIPGIYVPTPCFFHDNAEEEIDAEAISAHSVRLADAGVAGLTVQGSNGEAVHLTAAERSLVTRTTRRALDGAGYPSMPLIVGCGAQSVRETIALCKSAAQAGGDYALVLPPAYYKASYTREALLQFFAKVADASPLPLLVYNYPGAASGIDLDSDVLIELAAHPNIVGVKLTCGNVGKLARVAAATSALTPRGFASHSTAAASAAAAAAAAAAAQTSPSAQSSTSSLPFVVLAGSADFMLPALAVEGSGALVGLANIAPRACVQLFNAFRDGDAPKMRQLQAVLARADAAVQRGGVVGTKYALQSAFGYGGYARAPLPRWGPKETRANSDAFEEIVELEKEL